MSKKGRIIMGAILVALVAAVIVIWATSSLMGGAQQISRTEFERYVENAQFYKLDEKGDRVPNVNEVTGEIESVSVKDDNGDPVKLGGGYRVNEKNEIVRDVTDANGKTSEVALKVIWRVKTDAYQYTGADASGRDRYYCFGPSAYGVESWDSETFKTWQGYGVVLEHGNPNAGSWVSTVFSVLMIVAVGVVFLDRKSVV